MDAILSKDPYGRVACAVTVSTGLVLVDGQITAAYAARYAAKNVVAAGLADKCEIQLAYVIGVSHPVSIMADTFGTNKIEEEKIEKLIKKHFDLRPSAIIKDFGLRRPIYLQVASYGHFGRDDLNLPWEKTDKARILKKEGFSL